MKTILSLTAILVTGIAIGVAGMKIFAPPPVEAAPPALVQAIQEVEGTPPPMSELCEQMKELRDDPTLDKEYVRYCQPARPQVDLAALARQQVCNDQRKLAEAGDPVGKPMYEMMVEKGHCK